MGAREGIETTNRAFMDAVDKGDASAIATLYTEDARLLPPGAPPMDGRAAIEAYWKEGLAAGIAGLQLMTQTVDECDGWALEVGTAVATMGHGAEAVEATGKYVVQFRQEGDTWRLAMDIWNFDT
jgi:uncharacterized protein (TIGR02246 family)